MSLNSSLYSLLHTVFLAKCSEMLKNTIFPPKFEFPAKIANIFQGPFFGPKMIGKAPCHLGSCSKLRKIVKLFKVGGGRLRSPKVGECRAKSGNVEQSLGMLRKVGECRAKLGNVAQSRGMSSKVAECCSKSGNVAESHCATFPDF